MVPAGCLSLAEHPLQGCLNETERNIGIVNHCPKVHKQIFGYTQNMIFMFQNWEGEHSNMQVTYECHQIPRTKGSLGDNNVFQ